MNKEKLIEKRTEFFNDIMYSLKRKIGDLDAYFEQEKYSVIPNDDSFLIDPINGEFVCSIKHSFFGQPFELLYSVWQVGSLLKIGFLVKTDAIFEAFAADEQDEILHVWHDKGRLVIKPMHNGIFYDWEFDASRIYDSYQMQENYSMGIRHMHLRAMKTIYDFLERNTK